MFTLQGVTVAGTGSTNPNWIYFTLSATDMSLTRVGWTNSPVEYSRNVMQTQNEVREEVMDAKGYFFFKYLFRFVAVRPPYLGLDTVLGQY